MFSTLFKPKVNDIMFNLGLFFYEILEYIRVRLARRLKSKNNIFLIQNTKFFLPDFPIDNIQRHIVTKHNFFEAEELNDLSKYIPKNSVILDIGSNIGNRTLYWAKNGAKKIFAFEPVKHTFNILKKNIAINELETIVDCYNVGLSNINENADISTFNFANTGGTRLAPSDDGNIRLICLDKFDLNIENIDFIKIDVEGYEVQAILGMICILKKYKPLVFVESFPDKFEDMDKLMKSLGYKICKRYPYHNYLYENKSVS